ncbi:MAG: hypothetical protein ACRELV_15425, partial [Longimicrobiales bacterium]
MRRWSGVALALRRPVDDQLQSRLSTYLHPLAGRTLVWHAVRAIGTVAHRPLQVLLVSPEAGLSTGLDELHAEMIVPARRVGWAARVSERLSPSAERVLVIDAAASSIGPSLRALLDQPAPRALLDAGGRPIAAWLDRDQFVELAGQEPDLERLVRACEPFDAADDAFLVQDRAALARAASIIQRRIVAEHLEAGVTFLVPEQVLVDIDVRIGTDTVVYPAVTLEGQTSIGAESVIGPGCRVIDSQIGSGVELRGWNYVVNT